MIETLLASPVAIFTVMGIGDSTGSTLIVSSITSAATLAVSLALTAGW
jgi:hypothetical protein